MNELFRNHKTWQNYTEEELELYANEIFNYYRQKGFPHFELTMEERKKVFNNLNNFDTSNMREGDVIKQVMNGLNLVNYYMPHMWSVKCNKFTTPMDCFLDDGMFMKAIRKRLKHGSNISDAGIRKVLSWTAGTHRVSNFRPTVAKYIYDTYAGEGNVLDYSSGFGGRLLGAMTSDKVVSYTGTDPNTKTFENLIRMTRELNPLHDTDIILHNKPFEDLDVGLDDFGEEIKFDLSFSSPPYFNTEEYSDEETQSYLRYNTTEKWKNGFLRPLIEKNYRLIKDDGYFIINIANVATYKKLEEDTLRIATESGFKLVETLKMALSIMMKSGFKYESVYIFKKD